MSGFWKVFITAFVSTVIVGGITFYFMNQKLVADNKDKDTKIADLTKQIADLKTASTSTPASTTKTFSNTTFGFSFSYPSVTTVSQSSATLSTNAGGSKVISIVASDFSADIYVAKVGATGANSGSGVIGLYLNNKLSDASQVSKTTTLAAKNFSFSLLDVNADPSYVSAFVNLTGTLVDVTFTSIAGKGTKVTDGIAYTQTDLPQSAKDLLASFTKL